MFRNREHAGWLLVERLREEGAVAAAATRPLVLAIPRGGVEVGAVLARGLAADLDVVLARKLRAPSQPELALGAVSEDGVVQLNHFAAALTDVGEAWIEGERKRQLGEIERRRRLYRGVRPQAPIAGRTVILVDDGLATGATMIAALRTVRAAQPARLVVALPVGAPERLPAVEAACDRLVCLVRPAEFVAVGQFYRSFETVSDERVVELLRDFGSASAAWVGQTEPLTA
jgi:predicted phosphoribosyltransferase